MEHNFIQLTWGYWSTRHVEHCDNKKYAEKEGATHITGASQVSSTAGEATQVRFEYDFSSFVRPSFVPSLLLIPLCEILVVLFV